MDPGTSPAAPSGRSDGTSVPNKVLGARAEEGLQSSEQVLRTPTYIPELTLRSRLISGSPALYPRSPSGETVRGTVAMQVIVNTDGSVENVTVLGGPRTLRDAAVNAVRGWRFQPMLVHGVPAQVRSTLHIPVQPPGRE